MLDIAKPKVFWRVMKNKNSNNSSLILNTETNENSIRTSTAKGGMLVASSQACKLILQTIATAILARILVPEDFGLLAMVLVVSGFALLIKDMGLSTATVQKLDLTQSQVSCMFWINVGFGSLVAIVVSLFSPLIAYIYQSQQLILITIIVSSIFIIDGLGSQHFALLKRDMQFKKIVIIDIISVIISIAVAIILAINGAKYWSLVAQVVVLSICSTSQSWFVSKWRPDFPKWDPSVKEIIGFGGHLTAFNAINYAIRNVDNFLIGAFLGASQLGFYSKAYNLLMLPIRQVSNPIAAVALPALSRLQNDDIRFKRLFINLSQIAALVTTPIVVYSFIDADILVLILLGDQWINSTDAFRYLSLASLVGAVAFLPTVLCVSRGFPKIQVKWAIYTAPIIILGFIFGLKWGINGVALSFSITYPIAFLIFIFMSCQSSPVTPKDFLNAFTLPLISAFISGGILFTIRQNEWFNEINLYLKPFVHFPIFIIGIIIVLMSLKSGRILLTQVINIKSIIKS